MSENKGTLLVVEDDPGLQKQLRWSFDEYEVLIANDREQALAHLRRREPAVVTLDLGLPPEPDGTSEGFATLEQILGLAPDTKVIVITGQHDRVNAVKAIGMGAYDFYHKPFEAPLLGSVVERALRLHDLQMENRRLRTKQASTPLQGIITSDAEMTKLCRTIEKVAPSSASVLLLGESGTGKELLARAVHQLSARSGKRFVAINCAAIPDNLLESELFGYEKGAFTGAAKQTKGKLEYADGGTLFLDEVGDLPLPLQAKLLRFLQERVLERVGGRQEIEVDVRIVSATHQNLEELIKTDRFREDLFYRLSEIAVNIPPIRARQGDAALLAHAFLEKFGREMGRSLRGFSGEAIAAIEAHLWPGNVRELENCIKRAAIMAESNQIMLADLGLKSTEPDVGPLNLRQVREEAERKAVVRALGRAGGNVMQAAELLGVSRPTLYDLINRYGIR
jgi:two-component system, NtrC family, response regulator